MNQTPSAEAVVNLCRERGLEGFDLKKLKASFANRSTDERFIADLVLNYKAVAKGVDDASALRWFSEMKRATNEEPVPEANRSPRRYRIGPSYKAFGNTAALTFELDELRSTDANEQPIKTVAIEAASSNGPRSYNWEAKVIIQLTQNELPLFTGAMLGMRSAWEASGHGQVHNKKLKVVRQEQGVFVQVSYGSSLMSVRVDHGVAFHVVALCVQALQAQYPHLSSEAVLTMCSYVCAGQ